MSLPTSTRYKKYEPVVTTTDYLVTFPLFDDDDLEVRVDGVVTEAFSVNATYTNGRSDDAEIVLAVGVTDVDVEIYGKRVPRRDNDYASNSPQLGENLQRDIEATTAVQQEQARDFNRSIKLPVESGVVFEIAESAAERASKMLAFDALGNPTVAAGSSGVPVSTYMAGLLDDSSASEARTTLGLGSIATQSASAVAITGGSITNITDIAVTDGGTGASDATTARGNLSAAKSGANSDITALSGLTTALSIAQGGTGAATAQAALQALGITVTSNANGIAISIPLGANTYRIQWGRVSCAGNSNSTLTFPVAFTTASSVSAVMGGTDAPASYGTTSKGPTIYAVSATTASWMNGDDSTTTGFWIAVGY